MNLIYFIFNYEYIYYFNFNLILFKINNIKVSYFYLQLKISLRFIIIKMEIIVYYAFDLFTKTEKKISKNSRYLDNFIQIGLNKIYYLSNKNHT